MHYFSWQLACPGRWERSLAQRPGAQVHLSLWGRGGQTRRDTAQHSETRLLLGRPLRSQEKRPFSCVPSWLLKGPGILSPGTPCTRTSGAGAAGGMRGSFDSSCSVLHHLAPLPVICRLISDTWPPPASLRKALVITEALPQVTCGH